MRHVRSLAAACLLAAALAPLPGASAADDPCSRADRIRVPGAELQEVTCQSDLSDGYFPDDSTTNTTHGWSVRLPAVWNGQLVVTGAPGVRKQYANDFILSDWVLSQGYAYASTDKGNTGTSFFDNGARSGPGEPLQEWHSRVTQPGPITRAHGRSPLRPSRSLRRTPPK